MRTTVERMDEAQARSAAEGLFAQSLGLANVDTVIDLIGSEEFLKFKVGRRAPVYDHALRETLKNLPESNPYSGLLGLQVDSSRTFPASMEAEVLRGILARSTRAIAGQSSIRTFPGQFVPFQHNEETQAIQPATHLIVGRRGVGKSTLIIKAQELLERSGSISVILDMQPYAHRSDEDVQSDVLADVATAISAARRKKHTAAGKAAADLEGFAAELLGGTIQADRASTVMRRKISALTSAIDADVFVFLDDYHLVDQAQQPRLLETLHGALKGARGWLKVSGLRSLLRAYDPTSKKGLQSPGDAQVISLDLTLVDPQAAEDHLRKILSSFLGLVGIDKLNYAVAEGAFHRLVWANAGVPRDFLQMFSKAIEHASRAGRNKVELSDANLAIGEFGQQKMSDVEQDARNEKNFLNRALAGIEAHCLETKKVNAFLIRRDKSEEYRAVQTLSDLRLLHLLHPTITPHKAGERYEAYMLDYSLFTGFRRRPNIKQMLPADGKQFKAAELRKIPILPEGFIRGV